MSFDSNNIWSFKFVGFAIVFASVLVGIRMIYSDWEQIGLLEIGSLTSLLIASWLSLRVGKMWRPSLVVAVATLFFVIGVYERPLPAAAAFWMWASALVVILINLIGGEKSDVDTPKRTITIKFPRLW